MGLWFGITSLLAIGALTGSQAQSQVFQPGQTIPERHSLPLCSDDSVTPDAECYARPDFDTKQAVMRLADTPLAYWVVGQDLRIVARGAEPQLCCTFNDDMTLIGEDDKSKIWGLKLHLPHIGETRLELGLVNGKDGQYVLTRGPTFVGALAPPTAEISDPLKGKLETIEIDSPNLGETRKITIYRPPGPPPPGGYPVVYMADGQDTKVAASVVEALIRNGHIRPIMLVGIWCGEGPFTASYPPDKRGREYLPDQKADPQAYAHHETFVQKEVMPLVEKSYKASRNRLDRLTYGTSAGAAWAVSFGARHPDLFGQISGFGVATTPETIDFNLMKDTKVFVGAGHYDGFFGNSRGICDKATAAKINCTFYTIYSGHDQAMWDYGLVNTLEAVFKP